MKPIKIKQGEQFFLGDTCFTYSIKDGSISLKRVAKEDIKKGKSEFQPPTLQEVKAFFKSKGYTEESAEKAFNYYDVADWKDGRGTQVLNWRQKCLANWMKPENQIKKEESNSIKFFQ